MVLGSASSTATTTLRGLARYFAGADVNALSDNDVDGLLNRALHTIQVWIMEAYNLNQLSGTSAGINLVAGTNNYAFATDYVQINRIEINYSGNTNDYSEAEIVDMRTSPRALQNLNDTADRVSSMARPRVYIMNNKLYLEDPPANSVTSGIVVYYTAIQTELSQTTDEPIFPEHFHKGLCILAAIDYALPKKLEHLNDLQLEAAKLRADLKTYFARLVNTGRKARIQPKRESYA